MGLLYVGVDWMGWVGVDGMEVGVLACGWGWAWTHVFFFLNAHILLTLPDADPFHPMSMIPSLSCVWQLVVFL